MWLNKRGNPLDRSIVDISVAGAERLVFEGKAILGEGLRQEEREPEVSEGEVFDTSRVTISIEDMLRVLEIKEGAKAAIKGEAARVRATFEKDWLASGATKRDLEQLDRGYLTPGAPLTFEKLGVATVGDVLANPEKYVDQTLADPIEGVSYGANTARVLKGFHDGELFVNSFAHGGIVYQLRHDAATIRTKIEATKDDEEVKRILTSLLPYAIVDSIELAGLIKLVAKKCGCTDADVKAFLRQGQRPKDDGFIRNPRWGFIIASSPQNIRLAIERLGIRCRHNEFSYRDTASGIEGFPDQELTDKMVARVVITIDKTFRFLPENKAVDMVLADIAWNHRYHPVRDYFASLKWDGKLRLDTWLIDYAGAKDTPFNRAVGALWLTAGVRRIRQPGAKFDTVLAFEAKQGKNKSSGLAILAVKPELFLDDVPFDMSTKDVIEKTTGKLIIEFSEMAGHGKKDVEHIKAFLSRQTDKARMAYERRSEEKRRQWIGAGTINRLQYLVDEENRRYWPVSIMQFDLDALARDRDQLWAEAVYREAAGESITLPPELWAEAAEVQVERRIVNPLAIKLMPYFGEDKGDLWVKTYEVWNVLGLDTADVVRNSKAAGEAMQELGFEHKRPKGGKDRHGDSLRDVYLYTRGENPQEWINPGSKEAKEAKDAKDAADAAVRRAEEAAKGQNHKYKGKGPF
jgi:Virulence-associated protein E